MTTWTRNRPVETATAKQYTCPGRHLSNPDTVESLIWEKLNEKLHTIMLALGSAMDEPEDLLQLVLGMAGGAVFEELFAEELRSSVNRSAIGSTSMRDVWRAGRDRCG